MIRDDGLASIEVLSSRRRFALRRHFGCSAITLGLVRIGRYLSARRLAQRILGHKQRDSRPMIDKLNAGALIYELTWKIEARPAIPLAFVRTARWAAAALVVWNEYSNRPAWRADKHI